MPHRIKKLLADISLSIEEVEEFCKAKSFEDFEADRLLQVAIERELEIIGEALNRLYRVDEENIENRISEFGNIIGLRNIIAHGYDVVDVAIIWDVVRNHLPILKLEIEDYWANAD